MGIYAADQLPTSIEESELEQSVALLWDDAEKALEYLRDMQRMNGTE